MARAAAGGGGPDLLLIAAVGAMAFLALRSRAASAATGVPVGTATQLRPDYKTQRDLAYTQMGVGVLGSILGAFTGSGSPDSMYGGGAAPDIIGRFTGDRYNAREWANGVDTLQDDATNGFSWGEFGNLNGAYTFQSPVEGASLGNYMKWSL